MKALVAAVLFGCMLILAPACEAGCNVFVRSHGYHNQHHNAQAAVVVLNQHHAGHYYSVGSAYQVNAVAEKAAKLAVAEMLLVLGKVQGTSPAPDPTPDPAPVAERLTMLQQKCAKCHTGSAAKGGFDILAPLDCETKLHAISLITSDDPQVRMPKGGQLSPADLGLMIQELSSQ